MTRLMISRLAKLPHDQIAAVIDTELHALVIARRKFCRRQNARLNRIGRVAERFGIPL